MVSGSSFPFSESFPFVGPVLLLFSSWPLGGDALEQTSARAFPTVFSAMCFGGSLIFSAVDFLGFR